MKALASWWHGVRFRSRTEARWAAYFDALDIDWEYEPEGVETPSGPYLPDFWLPTLKSWAEVKPREGFTEAERLKAIGLAEVTGDRVLMLDGPPKVRPYEMLVPSGPNDDGAMVVETMDVGLWGKWVERDGAPDWSPGVSNPDPEATAAVDALRHLDFRARTAGLRPTRVRAELPF